MPTRWLHLSDVRPKDRLEVGGKVAPLARLRHAGLPVPNGIVIPASVFREALEAADRLRLAEAISQNPTPQSVAAIQEALETLPIPNDWSEEWAHAAAHLGPALAVRSSGIDEDGNVQSFAGQHHTALRVSPADFTLEIRRCWASLYADPALRYRGRSGPPPGGMAVLIQRMIEPRCAGVLFTINPMNGSWREMIIEAAWGDGQALVSGQVAPHWYQVRRPHRLPRGLRHIGARIRLSPVRSELPELPNPPIHGAGKPTLERRELLRLCRLGLRVERLAGEPQDVEWCLGKDRQVHLLQARPITASGSLRSHSDVLWTRRFIGERWPQPATPLGWSLMEPILAHFIAFPDVQTRLLGGGPPLRLVRGRPYINATVFRHLAFKLPGSPPPQFMLELVPPDEEAAWRRRFAVTPDISVYLSILRTTLQERRWERFSWNPITNPTVWDRFRDDLERLLPTLQRKPTCRNDAIRLVERHLDVVRDYIRIHICSLLFAHLVWQFLESALATWLPERADPLMQALATCPPGNHTLATNAATWQLAHLLSEDDLDHLQQGVLPAPGTPARAAIDELLAGYGHRSEASWEVMAPRWADTPSCLAPLLRVQKRNEEPPGSRAEEQERCFRAAREEVTASLSGWRRETALFLVHYTRRYLLLRENQRFWFDRLLASMRQPLSWLGSDLSPEVLAHPDDIAFLTWPELQGLDDGTLDAASVPAWVVRRKSVRAADCAALPPPAFLIGDGPAPSPRASSRMQGLGVSPGRARGRVRIIHTLASGDRLRAGEVLVAHAVDPGWTPLFPTAAAVILELGSLLSHGAVVAREYGLPAVVNIDGATRILADGQEITVDGTRGTVFVHP